MDEHLPPLPSLWRNGAADPDLWAPASTNLTDSYGCVRPEVGDLVAFRYAAWRVHEIRPYREVDLTEADYEILNKSVARVSDEQRPVVLLRNMPFHLIVRHHLGPIVSKPGERRWSRRLHDGTREISFTSWPHMHRWNRLTDPFQVCSCHGHVWPCQEKDQMDVAAHQTRKMDQLMATAEPGVCAHCLEAITTRQKSLTFPEPSRLVPGAPGPTFHAGRGACWGAAENYERAGRLADNPGITRVASCPGIRFLHDGRGLAAEQRLECTAGPDCTGLHGPPGYRRESPCWYRVDLIGNEGGYARPSFDCGYRSGDRACIGSDMSSGGTSISPTAADILWETQQESRRRSSE